MSYESSMKLDLLALPLWIVLAFLPSLAGIVARPGAWYQALDKPVFNPPSWIFGPAWTTLFLLMGVAAWLVWRTSGFGGAKVALSLFVAQLLVNAVWSPTFFALYRMDLAMGVIVVLWGLILATIIAFAQHSALAAWLLAPYLAWVSFAAVLNATLWWMNPQANGG